MVKADVGMQHYTPWQPREGTVCTPGEELPVPKRQAVWFKAVRVTSESWSCSVLLISSALLPQRSSQSSGLLYAVCAPNFCGLEPNKVSAKWEMAQICSKIHSLLDMPVRWHSSHISALSFNWSTWSRCLFWDISTTGYSYKFKFLLCLSEGRILCACKTIFFFPCHTGLLI